MSRAFVKEDVDPPERSSRARSASGLPPGATNYITARGAERLQNELLKLRSSARGDRERIAQLEAILASVTIVPPPPASASNDVAFGARITIEGADGKQETYRVVGVDELDFEADAVSWISPLGKALLASELDGRVTLEDGRTAKIVRVENAR